MSPAALLFVDSSAWIALIDRSDRLHPPAQEFWKDCLEADRRFLTSDYVLDEVYTLLRRRPRGLPMAEAIHRLVEDSRLIEVTHLDPDLLASAWQLFTGWDDKILSFTDCTSFALMQRHHLQEAFTFDGDFQRAGFLSSPTGP